MESRDASCECAIESLDIPILARNINSDHFGGVLGKTFGVW